MMFKCRFTTHLQLFGTLYYDFVIIGNEIDHACISVTSPITFGGAGRPYCMARRAQASCKRAYLIRNIGYRLYLGLKVSSNQEWEAISYSQFDKTAKMVTIEYLVMMINKNYWHAGGLFRIYIVLAVNYACSVCECVLYDLHFGLNSQRNCMTSSS